MSSASSGSRAPRITALEGFVDGPPEASTQAAGPSPNATASVMSAPSPVGEVSPS